jgi:predicted metalloendopeptidase
MKKTHVAKLCIPAIIVVFAGSFYGYQSGSNDGAKDPLDLSARDTTVSPAQNFFEYANGTWLKKTEIPADKTGWGSFFIVRENALHQMKNILDSCAALQNPATGSPAH